MTDLSDYFNNPSPYDQAYSDQQFNSAMEQAYGPQYRDDSLGSRWASWDSADSGGGDYAGITPWSEPSGRQGSSGMNFPSGGGGGGGGGENPDDGWSSFTMQGQAKPHEQLKEFMEGVAGRGEPVYGELPKLEFDKYESPEIDEQKIAMLTEQAGAQSRGTLRNDVLRRIMTQAQGIENPTQRQNFIREALAGYSQGLGDIQSSAGKEGRSTYLNMYYTPEVQEKQTNFQADINAKTANFQSALNRLASIYNFEGARSLKDDTQLYNYYSHYNL